MQPVRWLLPISRQRFVCAVTQVSVQFWPATTATAAISTAAAATPDAMMMVEANLRV